MLKVGQNFHICLRSGPRGADPPPPPPPYGQPHCKIMFLDNFSKQDQALRSHCNGKVLPHSTQIWLGFFSVNYSILGHPL